MKNQVEDEPAGAATATGNGPAVEDASNGVDFKPPELADLDRALADWARRHGADTLVAQAFALASWAVTQGHTCLALDRLPTGLMSAVSQRALPQALAASPLVGGPGEIRPLILENGRLYLQRYHVYETRLAKRLHKLMAAAPNAVDSDRLKPGHGLFGGAPEGTTDWQAVAAWAALRHHFCVIAGGPGTGKTYTIVRLLRVLVEAARAAHKTPPLIALAAPTGKAAARMLQSVCRGIANMAADPAFDPATWEQLPQNARTLHRLLGLTGATTQPRFNADNPLPYDVVIVDEASMVDLPMMAKLADAIADNARLILLGDRYQLASVESGAVLPELCAHAGVNHFTAEQQTAARELLSERAKPGDHALSDHIVTLQTSRRFNTESAIGQLAAAVNSGDSDAVWRLLKAGHAGLVYYDRSDTRVIEPLMDRLANDYAALIKATDPARALAQLGQQRVLTAVRQGPAGSETIDAGITERLARRFGFNPGSVWYHGRPVMVTRNDYRTELYNGDVGVALRNDNGELRVWFDGADKPRSFLPSTVPAHDTAYAMTIHKSQGSEFDAVTLVLPDYDVPVLTRELFYTGLSRARERLALAADRRLLGRLIARRTARVSGLPERIGHAGKSNPAACSPRANVSGTGLE